MVGKAAPCPPTARALRRYAADLGLADAVHFAGRVDDAALAEAYESADVLVVASEHEGFCLPVVEAMAHGLPVVAYRAGAAPRGARGRRRPARRARTRCRCRRRAPPPGGPRRGAPPWWRPGAERLPALGLDGAGARLADLLVAVREGAGWPEGAGVEAGAAARRAGGRGRPAA